MEVDEDNVQMSKFIEGKFNCQFEDGKTFYEATENEENFLCYRKMLRPDIREEVNDFAWLYVPPTIMKGSVGIKLVLFLILFLIYSNIHFTIL